MKDKFKDVKGDLAAIKKDLEEIIDNINGVNDTLNDIARRMSETVSIFDMILAEIEAIEDEYDNCSQTHT